MFVSGSAVATYTALANIIACCCRCRCPALRNWHGHTMAEPRVYRRHRGGAAASFQACSALLAPTAGLHPQSSHPGPCFASGIPGCWEYDSLRRHRRCSHHGRHRCEAAAALKACSLAQHPSNSVQSGPRCGDSVGHAHHAPSRQCPPRLRRAPPRRR